MNIKQTVTILSMATLLSACAVNHNGQVVPDGQVFNKERVLPLGAGLLGAAICNQLFKGHGSKDGWTAACGAAGYFISSSFLKQSSTAFEKNKTGETSSWQDPDGKSYSVTPTRTYFEENSPCREFRQTVEIEGQTEILTGKACRQNDGTWDVVK